MIGELVLGGAGLLGAMAWSRPLSAHIWSSRAGGGRRAQLDFQHSPGLSVLGVEVEAGLAPCLPHPSECLKELAQFTIVDVGHSGLEEIDHPVCL